MGFVRVHEQEAARANGILDGAIAKLNTLSSTQNSAVSRLSGNVDVLSSLIGPKLGENKGKVSSLIGQISALKGEISSKAKELDDAAQQEYERKQKEAKEKAQLAMQEKKTQ